MPKNLNNNECDHVGSFLGEDFRCLDCGHYLTKQEFQLKILGDCGVFISYLGGMKTRLEKAITNLDSFLIF